MHTHTEEHDEERWGSLESDDGQLLRLVDVVARVMKRDGKPLRPTAADVIDAVERRQLSLYALRAGDHPKRVNDSWPVWQKRLTHGVVGHIGPRYEGEVLRQPAAVVPAIRGHAGALEWMRHCWAQAERLTDIDRWGCGSIAILDADADRLFSGETLSDATDYATLATRERLLDAFGGHGLKRSWFDDLSSHTWLKGARKQAGQGRRDKPLAALFCPYEVMLGLVISKRGQRLNEKRGWRILREKFPATYDKYRALDPND